MRAVARKTARDHRRPGQAPVGAPREMQGHLVSAQRGQDPSVLQFDDVGLGIEADPAALPDGDGGAPRPALVGRAEHPAEGRVSLLMIDPEQAGTVGEFAHRRRHRPTRRQHPRRGVPGPAAVARGDDRRLVVRLGPRGLAVGKETAHQRAIPHPGDVRVAVVVGAIEEHLRFGPSTPFVGRAHGTDAPAPGPVGAGQRHMIVAGVEHADQVAIGQPAHVREGLVTAGGRPPGNHSWTGSDRRRQPRGNPIRIGGRRLENGEEHPPETGPGDAVRETLGEHAVYPMRPGPGGQTLSGVDSLSLEPTSSLALSGAAFRR